MRHPVANDRQDLLRMAAIVGRDLALRMKNASLALYRRGVDLAKERGIILSEKRTRDNVGFRTFIAQFEFMLGDTLLPKRIPIGLVEVIEKAKRQSAPSAQSPS